MLLTLLIAAAANGIAPIWIGASTGEELANFTFAWLPNSLPCFAVGFVAFHLLPHAPQSRLMSIGFLLCASLMALYVAWGQLPFTSSFRHPIGRGTVFAVACLLLVLALHRVPHAFLVNRMAGRLGQVSYSGYLIHWLPLEALLLMLGPVRTSPIMSILLWLGTVAVLVMATGALSSVTYRYIETPCIRMGSRVARALRPGHASLLAR